MVEVPFLWTWASGEETRRSSEDKQVNVGTGKADTPRKRWKAVTRERDMVKKLLSKDHMDIWDSSLFKGRNPLKAHFQGRIPFRNP